jgi:hypothetical protein
MRLAAMEAVDEAKDLRVGSGGVPVPVKMQPFIGIRWMPGEALDLQRQSLGAGWAARCARAHQGHGGWRFGRQWRRPEVEKKGSILSSNLGLGRPCPRGTQKCKIHSSRNEFPFRVVSS